MTFSIIGLTETWLADDCPHIYDIPTHNLVTRNRKTKSGGGVGIYVSKNINFKVREDLTVFHEDIFESICVELQLDQNNKVQVGVMYRPPNNKVNEFDDLLENFLMKINRENKKCYLLGDFNIDAIKLGNNTVTDKFINQLLSSSFYPLITKPTRITERSATLIDNILTNRLDNNNITGILFCDLSDHLPVFTIEQNATIRKKQNLTNMKRRITKENIYKLKEKLETTDWEDLGQNEDPNKSYDRFYSKFFAMYDECIPKEKISNKQSKMQKKPWLTKGLIKSLKIKNKLYKKSIKTSTVDNTQEYKKYRNKLNHLIQITKKRYYKDKFREMHKNIRQTWTLINEIINKRNSKKVLPNSFHENNEEITDPLRIAEAFNKYFVGVGPNLAKNIQESVNSFSSYLGSNVAESFFNYTSHRS